MWARARSRRATWTASRLDYQEILDVRPGLTGYSQLAFAEEPCILDRNDPQGHYFNALLPQKVALDRLYASRFGTRRDFKILIATIATLVLRQPVAVNRTTGALSLRRRPAIRRAGAGHASKRRPWRPAAH